MPARSKNTARVTALTAAAAALAAVAAAPAAAAIPQTTCFWTNRGASKFDTDPAKNYAFPDTGAVYWSAKVTMPPGSKLVLRGRFAHARYQSLNSYDGATNATTDALNDVSTKPDAGSTNPFLPGDVVPGVWEAPAGAGRPRAGAAAETRADGAAPPTPSARP